MRLMQAKHDQNTRGPLSWDSASWPRTGRFTFIAGLFNALN